jgi:hypothetical protein
MVFRKPKIIQIERPTVMMAGGLSRVRLEIAGWGLARISFRQPNNYRQFRWRLYYGRCKPLFIDVRPPGVLSVSVSNVFGTHSSEWHLDTELSALEIRRFSHVSRFPLSVQLPSRVLQLKSKVPQVNSYHFRVPSLKIPISFWSSENE